jgi:hypothetical protein
MKQSEGDNQPSASRKDERATLSEVLYATNVTTSTYVYMVCGELRGCWDSIW